MSMPAQPLYFGTEQRPLFGWLHRPPAASAARGVGILLCSPSGYEAICTHRSYRHFAQSAAARGYPALRFDYDGTGNSAGGSLDPDRVAHWLASIAAAIDLLKAETGVQRVCLFGVRVGASLAAAAARGRQDVAAMIAFAPVVKVNSYLREIRALGLARAQPGGADGNGDADLQEAAGFTTTAQTRADLAQLDLAKFEVAPAPHVLILERDDLPVSDAWPKRLAAQGVTVESRRLEGYVDMMRDAHASKVPLGPMAGALDWLDGLPLAATAGSARVAGEAPRHSAHFQVNGTRVRETATHLDDSRLLFGIVSEPESKPRDVVLLLNSGTIHHIGPSRLYVAFARQCAARGLAAVRLDLSGVGESGVRSGEAANAPYSGGAALDVREVVQFATRRFPGARVHLVGLCSGAYHGFKGAVAGASLASVTMVNPLTFFWKPGMSLEYADFQVTQESSRYARSATTLRSWLKLLRGRVDLRAALTIFRKRFTTLARHFLRDTGRLLGMKLSDDLAYELKRVARQDIDMFFVFSASDPGHAMLREQGGRTVRSLCRKGALRIAIVAEADHTFTARWKRDELMALLGAHLQRHAARR
jgi:alpha-beta hydrolase superfamily lysophospholipase